MKSKSLILLDANAILRYLLDDYRDMAEQTSNAIRNGSFTIDSVIAEVVYVLFGVYKLSKEKISSLLTDFLTEIHMSDKKVMQQALSFYRDLNLDFVDCILLARAKLNHENVLTFDKKLLKHLNALGL